MPIHNFEILKRLEKGKNEFVYIMIHKIYILSTYSNK